jgi:hypothetical protein
MDQTPDDSRHVELEKRWKWPIVGARTVIWIAGAAAVFVQFRDGGVSYGIASLAVFAALLCAAELVFKKLPTIT